MQNRAYKYAIGYFLLFSLLLLMSGALLFSNKIGFTQQDILHYYLGNPESFSAAKTYTGVLKTILPHIFAFGLFVMVLLHFLIFTKKRNLKEMQLLIYLTFLTAFLEIFTPFMLISGFTFFAYVKIISFFLFYILIIYLLFLLFKSILYDK